MTLDKRVMPSPEVPKGSNLVCQRHFTGQMTLIKGYWLCHAQENIMLNGFWEQGKHHGFPALFWSVAYSFLCSRIAFFLLIFSCVYWLESIADAQGCFTPFDSDRCQADKFHKLAWDHITINWWLLTNWMVLAGDKMDLPELMTQQTPIQNNRT